MKKTILLAAFITASFSLFAQKKTTTSAIISFDASTAIDALPKAENKATIAAFDAKTGDVKFEATVKNFSFSNPKMQEHFNGEQWLNSDKYATFTFSGKLDKKTKVNYKKNGSYNTTVEGDLTVKGIAKKITAPVTITVNGGSINTNAQFTITLADYGISGMAIEAGKVSKQPKITVNATF